MPISHTARVAIAFAAVYVIWGSTYLAIRIGVAELPPALFAGVRFVLAGLLMLAYARLRGARWPATLRDWRAIALTGLLLLVGANGLVTWSEQWIESNQAALIVATSALWLAGLGAAGPLGEKPNAWTIVGLLLGFGGVGLLVQAGLQLQTGPWTAYAGLALAPMLWAAGSIYSRRRPVACAPFMAAALQTLIAGVVLVVLGLVLGELPRWQWHGGAMLALLYLALFGSCLGFAAYYWLVHQVAPARLGTYAYVNPAVAVLLGWWILDERLNPSQLLGTAIILAGVIIVTWATATTRKAAT